MTQTLVMRATSLAASTTLLVLAGLAAFSIRYAVTQIGEPLDLPPIISIAPPPPIAPPAPSPPVQHTRPMESSEPAADPAPPLNLPISTSVGVATPDPGPALISNPHWLYQPRDLERYYPRRALSRGLEGDVQLDCLVTTTGQLRCHVASETPTNWGFGEAALNIARDHRMSPAMRNGAPVEGRYRMRIPFQLRR